jgi:hypothetical protein
MNDDVVELASRYYQLFLLETCQGASLNREYGLCKQSWAKPPILPNWLAWEVCHNV